MIKKFILCLLFCASLTVVNAQQFIERVYLKDSSFYEGYIIEQEPTKFLKIDRLKEKDTITVKFGDIWKITKTYVKEPVKENKPKPPAKKERYEKMAYLELLGTSYLYSLNFDMRTAKGRSDRWGFHIGASYMSVRSGRDSAGKSSKNTLYSLPFGVNYLVGKKKNFLELGLGATYHHIKYQSTGLVNESRYPWNDIDFEGGNVAINMTIGYRYVSHSSGIVFRAAFTPYIYGSTLAPGVGVGFGYKF